MKLIILTVLAIFASGCNLRNVEQENATIIKQKQVCIESGMDYMIGSNGFTGARNAYCVKPGDRSI